MKKDEVKIFVGSENDEQAASLIEAYVGNSAAIDKITRLVISRTDDEWIGYGSLGKGFHQRDTFDSSFRIVKPNVVICAVNAGETPDEAKRHMRDVRARLERLTDADIPILFANVTSDLEPRADTKDEIKEFAEIHGGKYFDCSLEDKSSIQQLFREAKKLTQPQLAVQETPQQHEAPATKQKATGKLGLGWLKGKKAKPPQSKATEQPPQPKAAEQEILSGQVPKLL